MSCHSDNQKSTINSSHWWLVSLNVRRDAEEIASSVLFDLGSTGIVTLEEDDHRVTLGAYYNHAQNTESIKQNVESEFARAGLSDALKDISISAVPNEDWMQKWKEGFEAVEVGERLVVTPSWKVPANRGARMVIQIDPGMAFGTGTHETTRLCLEAIERHWSGGSLLDVGTGTGILAIAAALLAPGSRVVAIDIDPQAVDVARENLEINNVSTAIDLRVGQPAELAAQQFDVVVANLTAEVIIDLIGDLTHCIASGGRMILSGILSELVVDVEREVGARGFTISERRVAGEWCALVAVKL